MEKSTGQNIPYKSTEIELLAPAGSFECLETAIQYGADSVYFGVGPLNMRARSTGNFRADDLGRITERCRKAGVKAYLTLNVVIYDSDLEEASNLIKLAQEAKVDAVIVSDQAVMLAARESGLKVHLSTQLNISNSRSLEFYSGWADAAVLARELTVDQVAGISENIKAKNICGPSGEQMRLEVFVHGALCMAVAGKCYLSLHIDGKSANRGECLQVCRRSYVIEEAKKGAGISVEGNYLMSPKDLCTIGFLDRIVKAGVSILKIEGRARSAEYIKETVSCYREAVSAIKEDAYTEEKIRAWEERLASVFNRGFWDGYYLGRKTGEWTDSYGNAASTEKAFVGRVMNYFHKAKAVEILVENEGFSSDSKLILTGETTGAVELDARSLRVNGEPADRAERGMSVSLSAPERLRKNDRLYIMKERKRRV